LTFPFSVDLREGVSPNRLKSRVGGIRLPLDSILDDSERFPLLKGIDPYSDTFFNGFQMKALIRELEHFAELDPASREMVEQIVELAREGAQHPGYYLVVLGE
jgi:hypothetical protein